MADIPATENNEQEHQNITNEYQQITGAELNDVQDDQQLNESIHQNVQPYQPEVTAKDLLFEQTTKHTAPVCYATPNPDFANFILNYNNTIDKILSDQENTNSQLPLELQSYDEYVSEISVPNPLRHTQLYGIIKTHIDNTTKYTQKLQYDIEIQSIYCNPYTEALRQILDFEKFNISQLKQCKRVYEVLRIISEARNARMQLELRLVNIPLVQKLIKQSKDDSHRASVIRQTTYDHENQKRISNRQEPLQKYFDLQKYEVEFRDQISQEITDYDWLLSTIDKHVAQAIM